MSQSATIYVNVNVSLEGTGPQPASFTKPMFLMEHSVDANRLAGPFTNVAALTTYGLSAGSPAHLWAAALLAQQPHPASFYIGRRDAADTDDGDAFDSVLASNTGAFYGVESENRDSTEILALAAAVNGAAYPKLHVAQSNDSSILAGQGPTYQAVFGGTPADGTYRLIFTGFGLVSPVNVDTVRAGGSPASNALLGPAQRTALTTALGGSLATVLAPGSIGGSGATTTFRLLDGLPTGTITVTDPESPDGLVVTVTDADVASRLFDLQYQRTALIYHPTDNEYLDGAWMSRCFGFDLDTRKGGWSYKRLSGIAGTDLTDAQVAALRAVNCNYFAPAVATSGTAIGAFTAQGWVGYGDAGAGRRIDVTTSIDWLKARLEERLFGVLLTETHDVPFTDAGINRFAAAASDVCNLGIAAGHLVKFIVPSDQEFAGQQTPLIIVPKLSETTTTQRTNRELTFQLVVYLRSSIERVVLNVTVRQ